VLCTIRGLKDFRRTFGCLLVYDVGVFKINENKIDRLIPNFWMEKIKCYELKHVVPK
jgi:hypothetical protein